jgi:RNA polymerase sigma factor (TIGR02999 family)
MVDESITQLLLDASARKQGAVDAPFPIVYSEMRRLSASYLRREHPGHTLQSTALVHEAYLRLIDQKGSWQSRAHFMGIAAQIMRRILLDHAKAKAAAKRGGGEIALELDESSIGGISRTTKLPSRIIPPCRTITTTESDSIPVTWGPPAAAEAQPSGLTAS